MPHLALVQRHERPRHVRPRAELRVTELPRPARARLTGAQLTARQAHYEPGVLILGKYRLVAQLGEGGMATVWLARNVMLDVPVALKVMSPALQSEELVERFLVEACVQARLKHPNIVRVTDFGYTQVGDPFIVMEYLEGVTLREFMHNRGRLNATVAVQMMLPVIDALCHAHDHGVVHRDLKPENIFLDRSGVDLEPKLLDFGIAKVTDAVAKRHVTQDGVLLGSPAYMAPEQACGSQDVDHRVDVWAACVVLYEAVSGAEAFAGEGYSLLRSVIEEALPPLEDTGAGEGALSRILELGLQKDPARRCQSMRELGTALAQWLCDRAENEDLHGNRLSRCWKVKAAPAERVCAEPALVIRMAEGPPRLQLDVGEREMPTAYRDALTTGTRRRAVMPRLMWVAVLMLASIAMPSKVGVAAAAARPRSAERTLLASALPPTDSMAQDE